MNPGTGGAQIEERINTVNTTIYNYCYLSFYCLTSVTILLCLPWRTPSLLGLSSNRKGKLNLTLPFRVIHHVHPPSQLGNFKKKPRRYFNWSGRKEGHKAAPEEEAEYWHGSEMITSKQVLILRKAAEKKTLCFFAFIRGDGNYGNSSRDIECKVVNQLCC